MDAMRTSWTDDRVVFVAQSAISGHSQIHDLIDWTNEDTKQGADERNYIHHRPALLSIHNRRSFGGSACIHRGLAELILVRLSFPRTQSG